MSAIKKAHSVAYKEEENKKKAKKIAKKILKGKNKDTPEEDVQSLAEAFKQQQIEMKEMADEMKVLRSLAGVGFNRNFFCA